MICVDSVLSSMLSKTLKECQELGFLSFPGTGCRLVDEGIVHAVIFVQYLLRSHYIACQVVRFSRCKTLGDGRLDRSKWGLRNGSNSSCIVHTRLTLIDSLDIILQARIVTVNEICQIHAIICNYYMQLFIYDH